MTFYELRVCTVPLTDLFVEARAPTVLPALVPAKQTIVLDLGHQTRSFPHPGN